MYESLSCVCVDSIQFKALFRVDINHTYNTSSNELLKSTMVYKKIKNIILGIKIKQFYPEYEQQGMV
jgi:hypothetical protein